MSRHIVDQPREAETGAAARAFVEIERREAPAQATRTLQRRPRGGREGLLRRFLRIARRSDG